MSMLAVVALAWMVFNSLWLCGVFVALAIYGEVVIPEPNRFMAIFEAIFTFGLAILGIIVLTRLGRRE